MTNLPTHTAQMQCWLERIRAGDRAARNELFGGICERLNLLARKMLRNFPAVRRQNEADDVVQNAMVRLLRALDQVRPTSVQDFFNLAAVHLRRELLDLARRCCGPKGRTACCDTLVSDDSDAPWLEPAERAEDPGEIDRWCAFHQEVERLPVEEREVVSLVFYHGWTQAEVAELFQVCERTVRRRWDSAMQRLQDILQEQ
jgi:RNA polymerase sigma-70 factor (ECF subfamily)